MSDPAPGVDIRSPQEPAFCRRRLLLGVASAGVAVAASTILPSQAHAQEASPVPATPVAGGIRSITKGEYLARVHRHFALEAPPARGGHVLVARPGDVSSLNPMALYDVNDYMVLGQLFSGLVTTSAIDGSWVPDLVDSWTMSPDGMTYHFHLDPRATWHDGHPVTAHDCAFTFDAVFNEEGLSGTRSEVVSVVAGYRAIDDYTFETTAVQPVATSVYFFKGISRIVIMPKHVWEGIPFDDWGSVPAALGDDPAKVVGCGPYRFDEWVRGEYVSIVRNDDYWNQEMVPWIDRLTWQVVPDTNTALQAFRAAESDICNVPESAYESLREDVSAAGFHIYDELGWSMFVMNGDPARNTPFVDVRVRQAMLYALDRDLIISTLLQGFGVRADGIYPLPALAYAPDRVTTIYNFDPDRARVLLDSAGWLLAEPNGIRHKDGKSFRIEILFNEVGPNARQIATYMQQAWRLVGINAQPMSTDSGVMFDRVAAGDFDVYYTGFGSMGDDMADVYRCNALPPLGLNHQRICMPEFDRLNDASTFELDPERRRDLLIEQGNVVNDAACLGLLYFKKGIFATAPRIRNFFANAHSDTGCFPWLWVAGET